MYRVSQNCPVRSNRIWLLRVTCLNYDGHIFIKRPSDVCLQHRIVFEHGRDPDHVPNWVSWALSYMSGYELATMGNEFCVDFGNRVVGMVFGVSAHKVKYKGVRL